MDANAEIILIRSDGGLILQHRDDKPGITNPGAVTAFGGGIETNETPHAAALREINEETNLNLKANQLTFWRKYHKTKEIHGEDWDAYYFIARGVSERGLKVFEGQGYIITHTLQETRKYPLSILFNQVVEDYFKEFSQT